MKKYFYLIILYQKNHKHSDF